MLGDEYIEAITFLFIDNGKAYKVNSVTERFKKFLDKNGLPKIRLHDLRHTFAQYSLRSGGGFESNFGSPRSL